MKVSSDLYMCTIALGHTHISDVIRMFLKENKGGGQAVVVVS